jgi:hypothetical protein
LLFFFLFSFFFFCFFLIPLIVLFYLFFYYFFLILLFLFSSIFFIIFIFYYFLFFFSSLNPSLCEGDRKTDEFLDAVHKKRFGDEIRQRKREKKLHSESELSPGQGIAKQSGQNSHKKKGTDKIVQVITDGVMAEPSIQDDIKHQEPVSSDSSSEALQVTETSATARRPNCSSTLLDLGTYLIKHQMPSITL